jgi:hypothetical protein
VTVEVIDPIHETGLDRASQSEPGIDEMRNTDNSGTTVTRALRTLGWTLAGAVLLSLAACGPDPSVVDERTPEEIVKERAQARWNALLSGDLEQAYAFTSPAYRSSTTLNRFQARLGSSIRRTEAVVSEVECEPDRCDVVVMVTYVVPQLNTENTRPLNETWILSDDDWWIHLDR